MIWLEFNLSILRAQGIFHNKIINFCHSFMSVSPFCGFIRKCVCQEHFLCGPLWKHADPIINIFMWGASSLLMANPMRGVRCSLLCRAFLVNLTLFCFMFSSSNTQHCFIFASSLLHLCFTSHLTQWRIWSHKDVMGRSWHTHSYLTWIPQCNIILKPHT